MKGTNIFAMSSVAILIALALTPVTIVKVISFTMPRTIEISVALHAAAIILHHFEQAKK